MTGTRPRAISTVSAMTRSCSGKSSVGDSPVVPTGTSPSMPLLIWCSTCSRKRDSSSLPSRNGVIRAVMAPLSIAVTSVHQLFHLADRLTHAHEHRPADDRVADVEFAHVGDLRDRQHVAVV